MALHKTTQGVSVLGGCPEWVTTTQAAEDNVGLREGLQISCAKPIAFLLSEDALAKSFKHAQGRLLLAGLTAGAAWPKWAGCLAEPLAA